MASPFQLRENFSGTKSVRFFFNHPIRVTQRKVVDLTVIFVLLLETRLNDCYDFYPDSIDISFLFFFGNSLAVIKKNVGLNT